MTRRDLLQRIVVGGVHNYYCPFPSFWPATKEDPPIPESNSNNNTGNNPLEIQVEIPEAITVEIPVEIPVGNTGGSI